MMYAGLEYLDEPRELERLATPFGGGMRMGAAGIFENLTL